LFTTASPTSPTKFSKARPAICDYKAATETPKAAIVVLAPDAQISKAMSWPYIATIVIPYKIQLPVS
jgi:hypothetical protein